MSVTTQKSIIDALRQIPRFKDLKGTDDEEYCRFDAFSDTCVLEVKDRSGTDYDTTLLEKGKWDSLLLAGKLPYYCVKDKKGISLFDSSCISGLTTVKRWCPTTSEFGNNKKIQKEVYLVPFTRAILKLEVDDAVL